MKNPILLSLLIGFLGLSTALADEFKHLFTAKLLLDRFEQLDLTAAQLSQFNEVSRKLTAKVAAIRESSGISKEDIKKRDEAYGPAKDKLQGDELWKHVQDKTGFNDAQIAGFRETHLLARAFREDALAILTPEQKKQFPKTRKRNENAQTKSEAGSPNIVLFFVDDLGWTDLGHRNPKFETPNIDALAAVSVDFQQAYVAGPACSPSRSTLVTGKHPARLKLVRHIPAGSRTPGFDDYGRTENEFHHWPGDPAEFPSRNWLPLEHTTYAEALKEHGYYNLFVGKWHLGQEEYHPVHQGFDRQIGTTNSGHPKSYYPPYFKFSEVMADEKERYLTDKLTDETVKFIEGHDTKNPFMISLWYYNVHSPHVGRKDLVAHFESKGLEGKEAHFAAMVKSVDESVGRVREALQVKGIADNTVLLFTSDQGSLFENPPYRGSKRVDTLGEGGARVPFFVHWPGVSKAGKNDSIVQTTDIFPTLVEIAGGNPAKHKDLDGVSLVDIIRYNSVLKRGKPIFGYRAYQDLYASVRQGNWKLFAYRSGQTALFNVVKDRFETKDLAAERTEKVKGMVEALRAWEVEMGIDEYSGFQ
ncbi:MAG: sulfatase-like hydrolase/transferase [Verrucomicrobiota bacterium]